VLLLLLLVLLLLKELLTWPGQLLVPHSTW
jgi:hypothetical protein